MERNHEVVRNFLIEGIQSGRYGKGAKLPTERELVGRFNVARSAVRTALASLESSGLVTRQTRSGTFVSDKAVELTMSTTDISPTQIMEARFLLEPNLAKLVAVNATELDFEIMATALKKNEAATDQATFEYWDAAFHDAIALATHNKLVINLYEAITACRERAEWGDLKLKMTSIEHQKRYQQHHREIYSALRSRNADDAYIKMLTHLQQVRVDILGY